MAFFSVYLGFFDISSLILEYQKSCWDCDDFYIGETKRRLQDRKTEHFKTLAKHWEYTSAIPDHIKATGHGIKWDHFEILAYGKTDYQSKKKEILFIQELNPILNTNPTSNKLSLCYNVTTTLSHTQISRYFYCI